MRFEESLREVFGEKADELSSQQRRMLKSLWTLGRRKGLEERSSDFEQGRRAGIGELAVLFTMVLRGRPMNQVFFLRSSQIELQEAWAIELRPWAQAALQQVMDAPDLEEAERVASALAGVSTGELMTRGQTPTSNDLTDVSELQQLERLEKLWHSEPDVSEHFERKRRR